MQRILSRAARMAFLGVVGAAMVISQPALAQGSKTAHKEVAKAADADTDAPDESQES